MSRRTERIGKLIQEKIGRVILTEIADPRITPALTSVTRVAVQEDLLRAKVYISILGTEAQQRRGLEALQHATGRFHAILRDEISLRQVPHLDFLADEQFKGAMKTWDLIRQAMNEIKDKEQTQTDQPADGGADATEGKREGE